MGKIYLKNLLTESVTVSVSGALDEYPELHSIMDIGFSIGRSVIWPILEKRLTPEEKDTFRKEGLASDIIIPDGASNIDEPTGVLNFYIAGIPERLLRIILAKIIVHLNNIGVKIGRMTSAEQSGIYKIKVIRIPIVDNPMAKAERAPELNLANRNFQLLFHKILGLVNDDDYSFSFPLETIEKEIESFVKGSDINQIKQLEPHVIEPAQSEPEPIVPGDEWKDEPIQNKVARELGSTMYDSGVSVDQLSRYIFQLNNIVTWAKKRGYKRISAG